MLLLVLLAAAQRPDAVPAPPRPTAANDLTGRFEVGTNLQVTLWAGAERVESVSAIDVDWRGRVWVAESGAGGRIVVLGDDDGDERCDSASVFANDPELGELQGLVVRGPRVVTASSTGIWELHDDDEDGAADRKQRLVAATGDGRPGAIAAGPDGGLWYVLLSSTPRGAPTRLGSSLVHLAPGGTAPGVFAHGFRAPGGLALDSFGNVYVTDGADDGVPACRTTWCLEGGDHGYLSADGTRTWREDRRPGQDDLTAHWHADDPGVVPSSSINGVGQPGGMCVYEGSMLRDYVGLVLDADAAASIVYAHRPVPKGAGYELETYLLMKPRANGADAATPLGFRPIDIRVGIDGSLYVADACAPGAGRILRVTTDTPRRGPPRLGFMSLEAQLSALCSPAVSVRAQAFEMIAAQGRSTVKRLAMLSKALDPRLAARALWLLALAGEEGRAAVRERLSDPDEDIRISAFRALRAADVGPLELVKYISRNDTTAIRREALLALRDLPPEQRLEPLKSLLDPWPLSDRTFVEAVGLAARGLEAPLFDAFATAGATSPDALVSDLAWRLHPPSALVRLRHDAQHAATPEQRKRALDAIAFMTDRPAAEAMLALARDGPDDVREQAAWWLRFRDINDWREYGLARQLDAGTPAHER